MGPHIYIKNASFTYQSQILFENLSLDLPPGHWVSLLGPSGVGKSSLLRLLTGLTQPNELLTGEITTGDHSPFQQQIAYMAQEDLLLPWLTLLKNCMLRAKLRKSSTSHQQFEAQAQALLEQVGLGRALHLYPHQLSGGMRQRAALVRTLLEDKPIVLMDEPFSALDTITRYRLQKLAATLLRGKTVFFITHDPMEALCLSHQIYIMHGRPAHLHLAVTLPTSSPRELDDPVVQMHQTALFQQLLNLSDPLQ